MVWRIPNSVWVAVRDVICLGLGVWGVVHEELARDPDLSRLGFFGILMVAPGALAARWLAKSDTGGQSSLPPLPPSAPLPPSPGSPPSLPSPSSEVTSSGSGG